MLHPNPLFSELTMIDYSRPLRERLAARKVCGPYTWRPTTPMSGRGFYQASRGGLRMDPRGSPIDLRLELADDHLPRGSRYCGNSYYCDEFGDCTMTPIIARLPRSRGFLIGWTMGAGMCASLEPEVWYDVEEAARAAHNHAHYAAEREQEYQREERERIKQEEREQEAYDHD